MPLPVPTVHPKLIESASRFYPQRITIQHDAGGGQTASGAPVHNWVDLPGHVDIPARVVSNGPGTGAGGWSGEMYAPEGIYDVDGRTMALAGHYPDILESHRAVWNGLIYDIQAVESDAEGVTTRLRTRKVS